MLTAELEEFTSPINYYLQRKFPPNIKPLHQSKKMVQMKNNLEVTSVWEEWEWTVETIKTIKLSRILYPIFLIKSYRN